VGWVGISPYLTVSTGSIVSAVFDVFHFIGTIGYSCGDSLSAMFFNLQYSGYLKIVGSTVRMTYKDLGVNQVVFLAVLSDINTQDADHFISVAGEIEGHVP